MRSNSIHFNVNSNRFDCKSIQVHLNFRFKSIPFKFNFNPLPIQFTLQLNSFQFNVIQFNSPQWKSIIWSLERSPPTASRKLQFFKRIRNQKIKNFRRPPDLHFSILFQAAKKRAFLITKMIDFDRFLVEIWKS